MILNAVDEKLSAQERRFNIRLEKMEERFAKRLDELTKTLDKFLKRLSAIEEEFTFMKADLSVSAFLFRTQKDMRSAVREVGPAAVQPMVADYYKSGCLKVPIAGNA